MINSLDFLTNINFRNLNLDKQFLYFYWYLRSEGNKKNFSMSNLIWLFFKKNYFLLLKASLFYSIFLGFFFPLNLLCTRLYEFSFSRYSVTNINFFFNDWYDVKNVDIDWRESILLFFQSKWVFEKNCMCMCERKYHKLH